jgi:hypothetical protein
MGGVESFERHFSALHLFRTSTCPASLLCAIMAQRWNSDILTDENCVFDTDYSVQIGRIYCFFLR